MKTAIIGLGNIGARIAKNLVVGGESIIVAARDLAKAKAFAKTLGGEAEAMPIADAVKQADVVDRKSTRLNSSHSDLSRMPSSA